MNLAVSQIPEKISESLSALTNPAEVTKDAGVAAEKKLEAYERALGITAKPSDTSEIRVAAAITAAEEVVMQALPPQLSEEQIASLSAADLRQQAQRLATALGKIQQLQSIVTDECLANLKLALPVPTPEGVYAKLPDNRGRFEPHRAYLFSIEPSNGTVLDELTTFLGPEAADQLVKDWNGRLDLNQKLGATQVVLFLDSNNKPRLREQADADDKTTQADDFTATGHEFADDLAATLLCARIFKKAQDNVFLSEGEGELYQKLKEGVLRCRSGALVIFVNGLLRADPFIYRRSVIWALGKPLSPELV